MRMFQKIDEVRKFQPSKNLLIVKETEPCLDVFEN